MKQVSLGIILSLSGLKGLVRIQTYTEKPQDLEAFEEFLNQDGKKIIIKKILSYKGETALAEIAGVKNLEEATRIVGSELLVPLAALPKLKEDFYYSELMGLEVFYSNKESIGFVKNLMNYGASDLLEIEKEGQSFFYPFVKDFVEEVSLKDKYIILKELETF